MKKIGLTVLALLIHIGDASALEIKGMTYNIRYGTADDGENSWTQRKALLIQQVKETGPDTLGLQEALRFQINDIRAALPQYEEVGIGREGGEKGEYSCILYNKERFKLVESGTFWLSETPEQCSESWESACVRICTWALLADLKTGARFYHFNTHLDHRSAEARLKGVQLIAQRIAARKEGLPFILTGDFNAAESSPPLQWLKSTESPVPMVDTYRVLHPEARTVGTFNRFKRDQSGAKIDYILTAPDVNVLAAEIDFSMPEGRCISDHYPVTACLRFADLQISE